MGSGLPVPMYPLEYHKRKLEIDLGEKGWALFFSETLTDVRVYPLEMAEGVG